MNLITHHILPTITFWFTRINQIDNITSLHPHTLQQLKVLEKIETNIILTTTLTIIFLLTNYRITTLILKKNINNLTNHILKNLITIIIIIIIISLLLNLINNNINTNNLTLKLRIKKFYQSCITLSIILFIILKRKKNTNRIIYIPTTLLTRIIRPAETTIMAIVTLTLILPIEIPKFLNNIKSNLNYQKKRN